MENTVQLIVYVDRFGGKTIAELEQLLTGPLAGIIGGVHLLPFYDPIDGADAGFDPIDHTMVDPRLGDWGSIRSLGVHVDVMADLIVNHVSADSPQFQDYSREGEKSRYHGFFLTYDSVFPGGATQEDLMAIYRPRPGLPFTYTIHSDGRKELLWTTFTAKQVDIDVMHPIGRQYLDSILESFAENNVRMIRMDAVGYAIKKPGSSCFMIPETFGFISDLSARAHALGMEVLVEIHSYYQTQIEIAHKVDWVYDFALPPLVLHAFHFGVATRLKEWIDIRPHNAVTVLDTHDGIGIVDIGSDGDDPNRKGLVPDEELDALVESIHENSRGESRQATGAAASNLDLYQVNCTFFDALGADPLKYLLARAIQFFLPGIPQVYYVGLLLGRNDMELLASSGVGRDINRHYYTLAEINTAVDDPPVMDFFKLIRLRNTHPAFGGVFEANCQDEKTLFMQWRANTHFASCKVDLSTLDYQILFSERGSTQNLRFTTAT